MYIGEGIGVGIGCVGVEVVLGELLVGVVDF